MERQIQLASSPNLNRVCAELRKKQPITGPFNEGFPEVGTNCLVVLGDGTVELAVVHESPDGLVWGNIPSGERIEYADVACWAQYSG